MLDANEMLDAFRYSGTLAKVFAAQLKIDADFPIAAIVGYNGSLTIEATESELYAAVRPFSTADFQ